MQTTGQVAGEISSSLTNWGFSLSESSSGMLIMACVLDSNCCCATLSPLDAEPAWHMPGFLHQLCSNSWHNAFYSGSLFTSHVFLSASTCSLQFFIFFFLSYFFFYTDIRLFSNWLSSWGRMIWFGKPPPHIHSYACVDMQAAHHAQLCLLTVSVPVTWFLLLYWTFT